MLPLSDEFKEKLSRDGRYPDTIRETVNACIRFSKWFGSEDMRKVSPKDIERYRVFLMSEYVTRMGKKLCSETIRLRLLALCYYFKFLVQNKKIFFDPTLNLQLMKNKPHLPDYIPSEKDVENLLRKPDTYTYMGIRDRAIFELMYTCPLRNSEIRLLSFQEIDMKDKYIYPTRLKGGRECGIPITASAYDALNKYFQIARPRLAAWSKRPTDRLFLTERGVPFTRGTLNQILGRYRTDKRMHPHSLRHACATHMLIHGARVRDIQVLLGHRRLTSTQMYTTLTANDIKDIQDKYHPRERKHRRDSITKRV